ARSPSSCRRPRGRQGQALAGARSSRVLDRHSTRRRIQRAAGAKGWLRRTEQKDGTKGQKALFPVLVTPSPQRGSHFRVGVRGESVDLAFDRKENKFCRVDCEENWECGFSPWILA